MNFLYELFAFCFEIDIPKVKLVVYDDTDFMISFKHPELKIIKEIRVLIITFGVEITHDLTSPICWIRINSFHLRKRNYKQFIELLQIVIKEKCVQVDNVE